MSELPNGMLTALRARKLLIMWADVSLPLSEREPPNRVVAINQWIEQAQNLSAIATPLSELPPLAILSLDPTARVERAFKAAGVTLRVVKTKDDVPARAAHNLLKLGGDLASRTGVILNREDVRDLLSDADKRYLLDEAQRLARDGTAIIIGANSNHPDFQAWWNIIQPHLDKTTMFTLGCEIAGVPSLASDFASLSAELKDVMMKEQSESKTTTSSQSGGVNINGGETHVSGDVTGRDKIVSAGGHIIHAEAGATVNIGSEHLNAPRKSQAARRDDDEREVESVRRQLAEARENLLLIEERISEYVMGTAVDLQLIKQQRRLKERIAELEQQLAAKT